MAARFRTSNGARRCPCCGRADENIGHLRVDLLAGLDELEAILDATLAERDATIADLQARLSIAVDGDTG
jgi:hypothetical protein